MTPSVAANVERHLYEHGDWLAEESLCSKWDLSERGLRRMLAGVAVRGEKGWLHVHYATAEEISAYALPKRDHAIGELRNVKLLRFNHRTQRVPPAAIPDADWPTTEYIAGPDPVVVIQPELLP